MEPANLLVVAMAHKCAGTIQNSGIASTQPAPLQPKHLLWMCKLIEQHADDWPLTKLHRWIGFIQGGMIANGILDLHGAKAMFDEVKNAFGALPDDQNLVDHLNAATTFEMDLGGQG